jgi:DNA-binding Xre family transcriptional regulator
MSTYSSFIQVDYYSEGILMVPVQYISHLRWDKELGERLKALRGKIPRRELATRVQEHGQDCSHQYIQKLEMGNAGSVSLEIIQAICDVLEVKLGQLIPTLLVQSSR